jgi:FkbM family methyltransferase
VTRALRLFGPHIPGWFPLVVERVAPRLAPVHGEQQVELLGSKMQLQVDEYMQRRFYYHCYEAPEVRFMKKWLRRGDVVVDVGAHVGFFTLLAAKLVGPEGEVRAFEPVPANFDALELNLAMNGYTWVSPLRAAVSDAPGDLSLGLDEPRLVGASTADFSVGGELSSVTAPAVTLDDVLGADRRVRLLKIDAEGHEPHVLAGAARILESSPPEAILFEVNAKLLGRRGASAQEIFEPLAAHGYRLHGLDRHGGLRSAPTAAELQAAAARWDPTHEPRSQLRVGLGTRLLMFNAVAVHPEVAQRANVER